MICRTKGWTSRKKKCVVFLFSDILLWTTEKGDLQNAVYLVKCCIMPSDGKSNTQKRFKIVFVEQHLKTLLLECNSERQKNEWYTAIGETVNTAKNAIVQQQIESLKDEAWVKAERETRAKLNRDCQNKIFKKGETSGPCRSSDEEGGANCESNKFDHANNTIFEYREPSRSWSFYEKSRNFRNQDLENFEYFDCISELSDTDYQSALHHENQKVPSTLSPFRKLNIPKEVGSPLPGTNNHEVTQITSDEKSSFASCDGEDKLLQTKQSGSIKRSTLPKAGENRNNIRRKSRINRQSQSVIESAASRKRPPVTVLVDKNFIRDSSFSKPKFIPNEVATPSLYNGSSGTRQSKQPKSSTSCFTISLNVIVDK